MRLSQHRLAWVFQSRTGSANAVAMNAARWHPRSHPHARGAIIHVSATNCDDEVVSALRRRRASAHGSPCDSGARLAPIRSVALPVEGWEDGMVAVLSNRGRHPAVTMQRNTAQGERKRCHPPTPSGSRQCFVQCSGGSDVARTLSKSFQPNARIVRRTPLLSHQRRLPAAQCHGISIFLSFLFCLPGEHRQTIRGMCEPCGWVGR
jgi:hypothetical protein